jgi:Zn-dependent M28 family amino/carboxypeptidase
MKWMKGAAIAAALASAACSAQAAGWSEAQLLKDVRFLAADTLEGRLVGTPGSAKARAYLLDRMKSVGLEPAFSGSYEQHFEFTRRSSPKRVERGVNLVGMIRGSSDSDRVMVVTAHYDHLGVVKGQIHNGADDNASGVAALLALAQAFKARPPQHTIVFALVDAEEGGSALSTNGARTLVAHPPVPVERIALNFNMDMVSKNAKNELYAVGVHHWPFLKPTLDAVAKDAPVKLLQGHDRPEDGDQDWTLLSDHAAFHAAKIPWVYFGVEDHPEYHKPTDDYGTVPRDFFIRSVKTLETAARALDAQLDNLPAR